MEELEIENSPKKITWEDIGIVLIDHNFNIHLSL